MKSASWSIISSFTLGLIHSAVAGTSGITAMVPSSYYFNVGVGAVFSNTNTSFTSNSNSVLYAPTSIGTSLFTLPNVNWRNQFKNGFDINAALGRYFTTNWHGNLEFLYQNIRRESSGTYDWLEQYTTGATFAFEPNNLLDSASRRAHVYSFMANINYDTDLFNAIQPFIGVGLGVSWLSSGSLQTNNTLYVNVPEIPLIESAPTVDHSPSLSGAAFTGQLKAGISYALSDQNTVILQYRLFKTARFKGSIATIIDNPGEPSLESIFYTQAHKIAGLLTQAVELNLRFNL